MRISLSIFDRHTQSVTGWWLLLALLSVTPAAGQQADAAMDLQGHRGARGLLPENTIPSMLRALEEGVTTLELDVVITEDRRVVLSHEPWMSSIICRTPSGEPIDEREERTFNIYEMTYDEAAGFDCGSRGHPAFPTQRPTAAGKPLLREVLRVADGYAAVTGRAAPRYNVEIKSEPDADGRFQPEPELFVRLVHDVLAGEGVLERTTIQSFDPRALRAARALDPNLRLALLVSETDGFEADVVRLGFTPQVYSPQFGLVDAAMVSDAHAEDVAVIPWTVNSPEDIRHLLDLGVDGIITDYPDVGRKVIDAVTREP